jgi:hypothetical protein
LASWAQAKQSAAIAEFARRHPPAWVHDDGVDGFESVSRYVAEEIACPLSLTVRGAENRVDLALRLSEALPETQQAWERGELDWPRSRAADMSIYSQRSRHGDLRQRLLDQRIRLPG